jgi:hypothetical protein
MTKKGRIARILARRIKRITGLEMEACMKLARANYLPILSIRSWRNTGLVRE